MNKTVFDLWLKALRSGNYVQCRGDYALLDEESGECSYCALGVLCDVADRLGFDHVEPMIYDSINPFFDFDIQNKLYFVLDCDPYELNFEDVISWNDQMRLSFTQIADRLEGKYGNADSSNS